VKDKLFYFGSFERYMQSEWNLGALSRTVPTSAMMGLDSSGKLLAYADMSPMLTTSNAVGTAYPVTNAGVCNTLVPQVNVYQGSIYMPGTGCVFNNNQIPTSLISKTSAKILSSTTSTTRCVDDTPSTKQARPTRPIPGSTTRRAASRWITPEHEAAYRRVVLLG